MKRIVVGLFLAVITMSAQSFYGSLRGRILDPGGGSISTASIRIVDEGTSIARSALPSEAGEFTFSSVTPATYTVIAEAPGFKRMERKGVIVNTQGSVTVDFAMELGAVSEQVNVTAETPAIETANASTGQVIDSQKLIDLPNLGRNPFMLSKLSEAVVQVGNPKFNRMQDQSGSSQISIAGGPVRGNNYTLDGVSITDSTNRAVIIPSQESVSEMKVQANTYDAEMGRTGGGTFNTLLRSGVNQLHGSAFGYLRQTDWVANSFFSNRAGQAKPEQPFRNYGGSIGGPIIIPKVYNGTNKTFFWISGEAYRQYDAAGTRLQVPTAEERIGDFSKTLSTARNGAAQLIYDPLTTDAAGNRTTFAGNVIPLSRVSSIGKALASYYPLPNAATSFYGQPNFDSTVSAFNRADQMTFKGDHQFAEWWHASASYLHYGSSEPGSRWFNNIASPNQGLLLRKVDATQVNSTFTLSPTMILTARLGYNRFPNYSAPISAGFDIAKELGFSQNVASAARFPAFPALTVPDMTNYGGGNTSQSVFWSRSMNATLSKFIGRHTLKAGFDYRLLHHDGASPSGPSSFTFNDIFTRARAQGTTVGTGSGIAAMLLGFPSAGTLTTGNNFLNYVKYLGFFAQDDFRITPKLTLNLGLRLEHETGPQDVNNQFIPGFNTNIASPLTVTAAGRQILGSVAYAGLNGNPDMAMNPIGVKFGPRVGFAYSMDTKTAIRGGYGVFWAPLNFSFQSTLGYSQDTPIVASVNNNFTPLATLENPYPNGYLKPVGNAAGALAGIGQNLTLPDYSMRSGGYVQQFSFDIQRQLPSSLVVSAGFIGSRGLKLQQNGININQLNPSLLGLGAALNTSVANPLYLNGGALTVGNPTITQSQLLRPFPQFGNVTLSPAGTNSSLYTAAYFKVQRRLSRGLTALTSYTWSRSMDAGFGTTNNQFSTAPTGPQNSFDLGAEYGLSATSTPHRVSMAITYELPFGKGKSFFASSRAADLALGGWSFNVVSVLQSGYPLSITQPNNNSVFGAALQRPNATGLSPAAGGSFANRLDGWFNKAAFSVAPQFTFGNLSRALSLRGPGQTNFDVSVFKNFSIFEGVKAQFRAEALNFTNTPTFYAPNTTFTDPSFGIITQQANYSRLIQLGVRFFL
jgi:trimeric autotransporter adhesin